MKYIANHSHCVYFHHALEEYILKETQEDLFMLWKNTPTVMVGKNQNIYKEVNLGYCQDQGINLVRRLSGGGAIYNDLNCFQFTFIAPAAGRSFESFARPVISALASLGVSAHFTGRNDILVDGRKISGNAQYRYKDKVLHHGTVLYDIDEEKMVGSLKPNPAKFKKRNIDSVAARVRGLKDQVGLSADDFMATLIHHIRRENQIQDQLVLTPRDLARISAIRRERFENPQWTYGQNPACSLTYQRQHPFGILEYGLEIKGGILHNISIEGDFFGEKDLAGLTQALQGQAFTIENLRQALETVPVGAYIQGLTRELLIEDLLVTR